MPGTAKYRGRIAPSPTGLLHLGHARTFWTACQRASKGTLLFRNEDLDQQRSRPEFVAAMLEDLRWLGIAWQGPVINQSERHAFYLDAFRKLLAGGFLYPCMCSRKELAQMSQAPHENDDDEPVYPGTCRPRTCRPAPTALSSRAQSRDLWLSSSYTGSNYRFRVPDGEAVTFIDNHLGAQSFICNADFGDFLVWRRDGVPSYQLACVVDDAAMEITEVVRGRDLLKSTARQILLQRALGLPTPEYYHCKLMADEHGHRLAKRHDSLSLSALRAQGLTPAQVVSQFWSKFPQAAVD